MRSSRWRHLLALLLALTVVLTACGRDETTSSDDDDGGGDTGGEDGGDGGGDGTADVELIDTSACESYDATAGVTDDSIKIGSSLPQSGVFGGVLGAIEKGYRAYIDYANEELDGVDGRKIELVTKDDEYESNQTVANAQELVQEDGVFALFNVVGTPNNLAIRDDMNASCVPTLFVATGAVQWGEFETYPWTIGSIPSYATEAAVFADYLGGESPEAKVAILYQNDDFGKGYLDAFEEATKGTDIEIVDESSYEPGAPDVASNITTLEASGADTIILATTSLACPSALNSLTNSGWDPLIYLSATCATGAILNLAEPGAADGVISAQYLKDPNDPQWADDEGLKAFTEKGSQYGLSGEDLTNGLVEYGWAMGDLLVQTLEASPELTREAVMETAWNLDGVETGVFLPGITATTSAPDDTFVVESMQLGQYNGTFFEFISDDLISFEGKSGEFVP